MRTSVIITLAALCIAPAIGFVTPAPAGGLKGRDIVDVDVDADVDADVNVDVNVDGRPRGQVNHGLSDTVYLGALVKYVTHLLGLYSDHNFENNDELLSFLVGNGELTEEQADRVGGINILGLTSSGNGHGLLSKLTNLDAGVASDQDIADQKEEMTGNSEDAVNAAVTLLDSDEDTADVDLDAKE